MNKWLALSQAFEHYGGNIALACEYIGEVEDDRLNELYVPYMMLLKIMGTTLEVIGNRIDELNKEKQNDVPLCAL